MQDKAEDAQSAIRKPPFWIRIPSWVIVGIAVLVGGVYGCFYISVITHSKKCEGFSGIFFLRDCLAQLDVNAIGDALGGAFGPLAFVFLAAALIVQSMELAAQRYEIDETQSVMAAQLEVAREQVQETKTAIELTKQQTMILRRQQEIEEQRLADAEFDEKIEKLRAQAYRTRSNVESIPIVVFRHEGPNPYGAQLAFNPTQSIPELSDALRLAAETMTREIIEWETNYGLLGTEPNDGYTRLVNIINDIASLRPKISAAFRVKFDSYALDELGASFAALNQKLAQHTME